MVTDALFVRMEARADRAQDVENFLREALPLVEEEQDTLLWFGLRLGPTTFGIFDAFPFDEAREAHLAGRVASALTDRADELLVEPPTIEKADILAAKLRGVEPIKAAN